VKCRALARASLSAGYSEFLNSGAQNATQRVQYSRLHRIILMKSHGLQPTVRDYKCFLRLLFLLFLFGFQLGCIFLVKIHISGITLNGYCCYNFYYAMCILILIIINIIKEELDGRAVIALGVRSRKLGNVLKGQS
jgi:hypothetical protein